MVVTIRRRSHAASWITAAVTIGTYGAWFLAQEEWALKTKYILFLLPVYAVGVVTGLRWVGQYLASSAVDVITATLLLLILLAHLYQLAFALGHL